jgi:hypothetical protein
MYSLWATIKRLHTLHSFFSATVRPTELLIVPFVLLQDIRICKCIIKVLGFCQPPLASQVLARLRANQNVHHPIHEGGRPVPLTSCDGHRRWLKILSGLKETRRESTRVNDRKNVSVLVGLQ